MKKLAFILFASLACAAFDPPEPLAMQRPTLLIINETTNYIKAHTLTGIVRVFPGASECVLLYNVYSSQDVEFFVEGRTYRTPLFIPAQAKGWVVQLNFAKLPAADMPSLQPAPRCR